ncbi:MAG: hypothetical protein WCW02_03265 [Candidatus Buchananbacteria bacterium]
MAEDICKKCGQADCDGSCGPCQNCGLLDCPGCGDGAVEDSSEEENY